MIQGALNFRDLGGAAIDSKRRVRLNRVYRSGALYGLTDRGLGELSALGIRDVFDLRSDRERQNRPHRLPGDGSIALLFHAHDRQSGNLFATLAEAGKTSADGRAIMRGIYRALPYDLAIPYRLLFRRLIDGPLPIAFNCAAGKDRTGVAAALILSALDVPYEEILREYLLSQQALADIVEMFVTGSRPAALHNVERSVWEPIVAVDAAYLADAFEAIARRNGSLAHYLNDELKLDDADLARLRERLIEPRDAA